MHTCPQNVQISTPRGQITNIPPSPPVRGHKASKTCPRLEKCIHVVGYTCLLGRVIMYTFFQTGTSFGCFVPPDRRGGGYVRNLSTKSRNLDISWTSIYLCIYKIDTSIGIDMHTCPQTVQISDNAESSFVLGAFALGVVSKVELDARIIFELAHKGLHYSQSLNKPRLVLDLFLGEVQNPFNATHGLL